VSPPGTYVPQPPPQGMIFRDLLLSNCIPSSSAMMRKKVLQETGLFNPAYRIAMDYDLWLRLAVRYPIEVVQEPLMQYRQHMGGISSNRAEMIWEDLEIMEKWLQEKRIFGLRCQKGFSRSSGLSTITCSSTISIPWNPGKLPDRSSPGLR